MVHGTLLSYLHFGNRSSCHSFIYLFIFFFHEDFPRSAGTTRMIGLTSSHTLSSYLPTGERKKKKHRGVVTSKISQRSRITSSTTLTSRQFHAIFRSSFNENPIFYHPIVLINSLRLLYIPLLASWGKILEVEITKGKSAAAGNLPIYWTKWRIFSSLISVSMFTRGLSTIAEWIKTGLSNVSFHRTVWRSTSREHELKIDCQLWLPFAR